ncbi:hypothetical protein [Microtetraspora sp. NBRC 16547]|uniref:hypothetical protein n=1 Tax=Microtetraspora sp. NBRC 16547 TaxID=3030993 RepID=UPI0024A10132|nr:hypothetical protein [Microtetraspora sp. NBRC 16547]GLW96270.1 hypothetical protein Misp02_03570 [Microtetraspora sp. NBRC 16547]
MDHSSHGLLPSGSQTAVSERMRELLARAAQDHVYEQRTQGAVLDEIRQRLEGMEWLLRELRERGFGGLFGMIEAVDDRLDGLTAKPPTWAESLARHVEVVRDQIEAVGEGVDRLQASMEAAAGRFTRIDTAVGELARSAERLREQLDGVEDRVEATEDHLADLGARMTGMAATLGVVDARLVTIDTHLSRHDDRFDVVDGRIDGRFTTLDERLISTETRLTGRVDAVRQRVDEVGRRVQEAGCRPEVGGASDVDGRDGQRRVGRDVQR